jgi:hypothetical protein
MGLLSSIVFNGSKVARFVLAHEPQIERIVGIGLYGASIYTTYHAAQKQQSIKDSYNFNMDQLEGDKIGGKLTEEEYRAERKQVTRSAVGHSILNWVPTALCFAGGTSCFIRSTHVLTKRGLASAALAELYKTKYEEYRDRVAKINGEETEKKLYEGKATVTSVEKDKKGKVKEIHSEEESFDNHGSPYSLLVGPETLDREAHWDNSSDDYNVQTVLLIAQRANQRLRRYGHVWLEDVIKDLDLWNSLTPEKQLAFHEVGWLSDKCGGKTSDEGIRIKVDRIPRRKFGGGNRWDDVCCKANPFWIDFNVEGNILTKMRKRLETVKVGNTL